MSRSSVFIVDDHPTFRLGLRALLESTEDLVVCGEAEDPGAAREDIRRQRPALVLVDLALRDESGLELVRLLLEEHPSLAVLVLSMHEESLYAERALQAGARGYLMKDTPSDQIIAAVREVLRDRVVLSHAATQRLLQRQTRRTDPPGTSAVEQLSDRQLQIFELLGRGRSTLEIAGVLHISAKTVETHVAHIKQRLGISRLEELRKQAAVWVNLP